jgi:type VI secretion system secreted protein Hcp
LTVRRANGAPQGVDYFTLTLNDVLVSGISVSTSGGEDRMTENVTFNYGTYTYSYTPIKKDGSKLSPLTTKFNIMENRLG